MAHKIEPVRERTGYQERDWAWEFRGMDPLPRDRTPQPYEPRRCVRCNKVAPGIYCKDCWADCDTADLDDDSLPF